MGTNSALERLVARAMAASLLCAPVVYPWYMLWLLPFVAADHHLDSKHYPNLLGVASAHAWSPWLVPGWIMLLDMDASR